MRQQGYLWVTCDAATAVWQRELVARQQRWGLDDVEILAGGEVRRRFPYIAPAAIQARFRAGDGLLDQKRAALGLAAASGATIVTGCGATGFRLAGGRLTAVETTAGLIATETAVIAAGPFAGPLAATAGLVLPLTNIRRQKVILPELPQAPSDAPMTIDDDTGTHWRPALRGAYLLGADPDTLPGPPLEDVPPDAGLALRLLDPASPLAAARIAPFWAAVWAHGGMHWAIQAGQYTMTPDSRPPDRPDRPPRPLAQRRLRRPRRHGQPRRQSLAARPPHWPARPRRQPIPPRPRLHRARLPRTVGSREWFGSASCLLAGAVPLRPQSPLRRAGFVVTPGRGASTVRLE